LEGYTSAGQIIPDISLRCSKFCNTDGMETKKPEGVANKNRKAMEETEEEDSQINCTVFRRLQIVIPRQN